MLFERKQYNNLGRKRGEKESQISTLYCIIFLNLSTVKFREKRHPGNVNKHNKMKNFCLKKLFGEKIYLEYLLGFLIIIFKFHNLENFHL